MIEEMRRIWNRNTAVIFLLFALLISVESLVCLKQPLHGEVEQLIPQLNEILKPEYQNHPELRNSYISSLGIRNDSIFARVEEKADLDQELSKQYDDLINKQNSSLYKNEEDQKKLKKQINHVTYMQSLDMTFINDVLYVHICEMNLLNVMIIMVIAFYFVYRIFISDVQTGSLKLFSTTESGLHRIFLHKTIVLLLTITSLFTLKLLIEFAFLKYDGFTSVPIQRIHTFQDVVWKIGSTGYLLYNEMICLLTVLLIMILFLLLFSFFNHVAVSFMVIAVVTLMEYLAYSFISINTSMVVFKKYNVFALLGMLRSRTLFYEQDQYLLIGLILLIALIIGSILFYFTFVSFTKRRQPMIQIPFSLRNRFIVSYKLIDLYLYRKYLIVICAFLGFLIIDYSNYMTVQSYDEIANAKIREQYYGRITDEKLLEINEKIEKAEQAEVRYAEITSGIDYADLDEKTMLEMAELQSLISSKNILMEIRDEMDLIRSSNGTHYVETKGLQLWLGSDSSYMGLFMFYMVLVPSLLFAALSGQEMYRSDISVFANVTKRKKSYHRWNLILCAIHSILFVCLFLFQKYMKISKYYTIYTGEMSVNNLFGIRNYMPLNLFLVIWIINYILLVTIVCWAVLLLSKKMNMVTSFVVALFAAGGAYLLPWGLGFVTAPWNHGVSLFLTFTVLVIMMIMMYRKNMTAAGHK